jgi:NADP-dependent aldehyde dehydrogenase
MRSIVRMEMQGEVMDVAKVLLAGNWQPAHEEGTFQAENPATGEKLPQLFPISSWADCELALASAAEAAVAMRALEPERIAAFLEAYAAGIEAAAPQIVEAANQETGLPITPRLRDVELPRTTNQLRQAAAAAREESWKRVTLDLERNIRSCFAPIGPVVVFGPNNFPFAFNGISGGDFAAAIAAGNPVIAKAHPLHPETSRLLAEQALMATEASGLPSGAVQMLYHLGNETGLRLVSDPRLGAVGFTGSRSGGMALKRAAEEAGKPIYLEMSSINPVIFLPGALSENGEALARELTDSCLAGSGQFCTSPNLILLWQSAEADTLLASVAKSFSERTPAPLLSAGGLRQMETGVKALLDSGAHLIVGGEAAEGPGYRYANTLLRTSGAEFLAQPKALQHEVFGNVTTAVAVSGIDELLAILQHLEGNLTGTIYSAKSGADDALYAQIEPPLREKVGRLLNDKMPTGVAVSPAMQHGGPYPATAHAGFTSVGIPAALTRFAVLQCYDGVRAERLPTVLRDTIANPKTWRSINGGWVQG